MNNNCVFAPSLVAGSSNWPLKGLLLYRNYLPKFRVKFILKSVWIRICPKDKSSREVATSSTFSVNSMYPRRSTRVPIIWWKHSTKMKITESSVTYSKWACTTISFENIPSEKNHGNISHTHYSISARVPLKYATIVRKKVNGLLGLY